MVTFLSARRFKYPKTTVWAASQHHPDGYNSIKQAFNWPRDFINSLARHSGELLVAHGPPEGHVEQPRLREDGEVIHATLFSLQSWLWWEWIPSKSNCADAISQLGAADPWYQTHVGTTYCPLQVWNLPLPALLRVTEYI